MISVTLVGSGNVAHHLANALSNAPNVVLDRWVVRTPSSVLIDINTKFSEKFDEPSSSQIIILAISDDAIADYSASLNQSDALLVHTSGSVNLHHMDKKHRRGVFYPLQTFSKNKPLEFSSIPICIEALQKEDLNLLTALADALGCKSRVISSEQRLALHLAAVFVNNFSNQMYRIAHEITDGARLDFDLLKPLILETAMKVQDLSPYQAQTGPALRKDQKTIKRHLKQLEKENHRLIYELITKSIQQTHGK
ncbi:MAG: DUF2520 domain-containing protein [Bacteroidetes bacterium]|jgi:predicted short-subunit dehydrogenase-like oxidoreductase (DUF2520 family)|nr:DUF2520 domain-containing protein [Bacteroidota bacterium]MDA0878919.1 DUF2520 domain-containing protein [Bacteroidota bacterium]MDA1115094.1 DUF2520 domain-containing protein [Bacteroidota bacterium]